MRRVLMITGMIVAFVAGALSTIAFVRKISGMTYLTDTALALCLTGFAIWLAIMAEHA